jgi:hypothetical protein
MIMYRLELTPKSYGMLENGIIYKLFSIIYCVNKSSETRLKGVVEREKVYI